MENPSFLACLSFLLLLLLCLLAFLRLILRPWPVKIPIKNRHVLITGGSSGIGLALAHHAVLSGAQVTILARDPTRLQQAKDSIMLATGADVATISADVRDYEEVKKALDKVGPVDVLVCSHGVFFGREVREQGMDDVRLMIDVNLVGTFHVIKAALPGMKMGRDARGPGSIAIMSQAGQAGVYGYTAYSATKFGLRGLAEALQQEVIADNIHVSVICPPDTETPGLKADKKRRPALLSIIASSSRAMKADEVAKKSLDGIQSGSFFVSCNFVGFLLSIATAGLSPQRSSLMAFVEVIAIGLCRVIGLCFLWSFYRSINKWNKQNKR